MVWIATGLGVVVVALLAWGAGERHRRRTAENRLWVREEIARRASHRGDEEPVILKFEQPKRRA
jgi:hypothetical protein